MQYVLAMYDIRGKQEFIFKSTHLQEIVGGSYIISECFRNYLYPVAKQLGGLGIYHDNTPFTRENFERHLEEGYVGELVYDGGGNFLLLMKDSECFKEVTYLFTKKVYEEVGTLKVLGTFVPIDNFDDFEADRVRLYAKHREHEKQNVTIGSWGTLPIVQVDTQSSLPLQAMVSIGGKASKVSKESKAKYNAYHEKTKNVKEPNDELCLDRLVTKKGEESLLAVIYIDGNSMGAKVQKRCENMHTYEECVAALRQFSDEIQRDYVEERKKDIDNMLMTHPAKESGYNKRLVLGAGDEINLICNAQVALDVARTYLNGLPKGASACAGIAIFHSHMPYADVYALAEECCENAKKLMKKRKIGDACFIDFHYCQGSIGVSLDAIRKANENEEMSLPWLLKLGEGEKAIDSPDFELIGKMKEFLNIIGRSNVKGLLSAAKEGEAALELELHRIVAHMSEEDRTKEAVVFAGKMQDKALRRKLIYDMVSVYDIWFVERGENK